MGKRYTTSEAADRIGVSRQTLYSWIDGGHVNAPKPLKFGRSTIRLWTKGDIQKARRFKNTLKRGPHAKKTRDK
jgi:excisionase family DNA binding protein